MEQKEYRKVIEYVKELIAEEKLCIGDKLPTERDLAETLMLGRYSVREALRVMENMGVIESRQGAGNFLVSNISKGLTDSLGMLFLAKQVGLLEMSQMRRAIELQASQLAFDHLQEEDFFYLKDLCEKMNGLPPEDAAGLDKEFHYTIIRLSGNQLFISIMEALTSTCEEHILHVLSKASQKTREQIHLSHGAIYSALFSRDKTAVYEAIQAHYAIIDTLLLN